MAGYMNCRATTRLILFVLDVVATAWGIALTLRWLGVADLSIWQAAVVYVTVASIIGTFPELEKEI